MATLDGGGGVDFNGWILTAGERLLSLLNWVCVSEFLAGLEGGQKNMKEEDLGRLNVEERREVEACGTYCCWEIVLITKNLLYKIYNDKYFSSLFSLAQKECQACERIEIP